MKKASFWNKKGDSVQCMLCPHNCVINDGQAGVCRQRKNIDGTLYSANYGVLSAAAMDPIEKKPLYHLFPGSNILSVGSIGCNLSCQFCQNWSIAHQQKSDVRIISSDQLVDLALQNHSIGIAYTYNEPSIWYEFVLETCQAAKKEGLINVLVTNGFISKQPLKNILPYIDAMNIDVKSFNDAYYKKFCNASLKPVLETVETAYSSTHVEITTLIIGSLNDKEDEMECITRWLSSIDKNIPFHISRYFPNYKMTIEPTSIDTLLKLSKIAKKKMNYVYLGNVWGFDNNTYCPECGSLLIERKYTGRVCGIKNGKCIHCSKPIYGIF